MVDKKVNMCRRPAQCFDVEPKDCRLCNPHKCSHEHIKFDRNIREIKDGIWVCMSCRFPLYGDLEDLKIADLEYYKAKEKENG